MKKTYVIPEMESIKIGVSTMLCLSKIQEEGEEGSQLSKGFSGSPWDDGDVDAEEN